MFNGEKGELQRAVPVYAGGARGSFTAAAQRLGLAQSGVSRSFASLKKGWASSCWCAPRVNFADTSRRAALPEDGIWI